MTIRYFGKIDTIDSTATRAESLATVGSSDITHMSSVARRGSSVANISNSVAIRSNSVADIAESVAAYLDDTAILSLPESGQHKIYDMSRSDSGDFVINWEGESEA